MIIIRSRYQRGTQRDWSHLFFPNFQWAFSFLKSRGVTQLVALETSKTLSFNLCPKCSWNVPQYDRNFAKMNQHNLNLIEQHTNSTKPSSILLISPIQKKHPHHFSTIVLGARFLLIIFETFEKESDTKNTARTPTNWLRHFLHPILTPSWKLPSRGKYTAAMESKVTWVKLGQIGIC